MTTVTPPIPPVQPAVAPGGEVPRRVEDRLEVSAGDIHRSRFCFLGEFGYELISWIPYLLYLKEQLGLRLRTASRPGSSVFYYFSDDHVEVEPRLIGACWGEPSAYAELRERFAREMLVHPGEHRNCVNRRHLLVGGHEWTTRDIHRPIAMTNYVLPDFSFLPAWSPIPGRPIVVLNNKYLVQWEDRFDHPVNYFDPDALVSLRNLLTSKGYGVVYNHFVEVTSNDELLTIEDRGLFGLDGTTFDMRSLYDRGMDPAERNRLQISLYRAARLVIGPQGGNLYLPAICRIPLAMLMRYGDYIDYLELGRIYGVDVDAFYEPRHLLHWLSAMLPTAPAP